MPISPWHMAVLVPMSFLVQMLPVSVNGFGLREATFSLYFSRLGLPIEAALVISLLGADWSCYSPCPERLFTWSVARNARPPRQHHRSNSGVSQRVGQGTGADRSSRSALTAVCDLVIPSLPEEE